MIRIRKDAVITPELIKKLVTDHRGFALPRMDNLDGYYQGKHKILTRTMKDASKPNNKAVHPFANYITDLLTGYFIGEPVSYTSKSGKDIEELKSVFSYNDEQDENAELAKDCSIYGKSYELLYVDEAGEVRFKKVSPKEIICLHSTSMDNELLYVIRHYKDKDPLTDRVETIIELYSAADVKTYRASEVVDDLLLVEERPHFFGLVPFAEYKNNDEEIGDFELVISLIDAYDQLESDVLNDFQYFTDAYLAIYGAEIDKDDLVNMKESRTISLPYEGTKAEWLVKNVNDAQIENTKTRIVQDIHKFSKCPAMTDENFAANASGVAMRYKLMGTENLTAIKERKFKKGLQRRLELLSTIANLKGALVDWRDVEISFTRNLPVNAMEIADLVNKLRGIVSNETLISQLPFIEDVEAEVKKVEEEKEVEVFDFNKGEVENGEILEGKVGADSK